MTLQIAKSSDFPQAPHDFVVWDLVEGSDWVNVLGEEYARLRTTTRAPIADVVLDGIGVVDTAAIEARLKAALVPCQTGGNLDIVRSDFGEVAAIKVLEQEYNAEFAYKSVRDRETIQLPGRGIDALGVELQGRIKLVLGEVKVSDERGRVPQVVDQSEDSLSKQLAFHIAEHGLTSKKIWDAGRRAMTTDLQMKFFSAAVLWDDKKWDAMDVVCCAVLIRSEKVFHERDFGKLRKKPEKVNPGAVRFLILRVPGELDAAVGSFHSAAKATKLN